VRNIAGGLNTKYGWWSSRRVQVLWIPSSLIQSSPWNVWINCVSKTNSPISPRTLDKEGFECLFGEHYEMWLLWKCSGRSCLQLDGIWCAAGCRTVWSKLLLFSSQLAFAWLGRKTTTANHIPLHTNSSMSLCDGISRSGIIPLQPPFVASLILCNQQIQALEVCWPTNDAQVWQWDDPEDVVQH
jgi:hypothetical protein